MQLLIHPILRVRRDARGRLRALQLHRADRGAEQGAEASSAQVALESWQHVQIDALAGEAECSRPWSGDCGPRSPTCARPAATGSACARPCCSCAPISSATHRRCRPSCE